MSIKRRVVVTGVGVVTPLGCSMNDTWNGLMEGRSVAGPVKQFDAVHFPSRIAFEVGEYHQREAYIKNVIGENHARYLNRAGFFGMDAALQAFETAQILKGDSVDRDRLAVCLGVGVGSPGLRWYRDVFLKEGLDKSSVFYHRKYYPHALTTVVAHFAQARGGSFTVHTACASSGQALGEAFDLVTSGQCDAVVTGGADSMINPFHMAGFCLLGALSKRNDDPLHASRPFDVERDGFVLGEGACVLVFEEYEHAKKRGVEILGEICGYGVTESAYRITDLHPEGRGAIEAMQMALDDACIRPEDVGYINAHGTSTLLNDKIESLAIAKVFPKEACDTVVSSTKSMTGHLISAAGALEFAIALEAVRRKVAPPSINIEKQDPSCDIRLTPAEPVSLRAEYALSNSIGFGGSNTSLIARRITS